jgi:hypothetical protein
VPVVEIGAIRSMFGDAATEARPHRAVDVSGEPYMDLEREAAAMLARE